MTFTLPDLPYSFDALEPHIDAYTMQIHHDKHHAGYVTKLNAALESLGDSGAHRTLPVLLANLSTIPDAFRTAIRNNGGGHYNHSLFWRVLAPDAGGEPSGELAKAITDQFSSFENFQKLFSEAAMSVFGSGWCWLVVNNDGHPAIISTPNQDSPVMYGSEPILGIDLWEHSYYLHYQNRRADYVQSFWNAVNWPQVQRNFAEIR